MLNRAESSTDWLEFLTDYLESLVAYLEFLADYLDYLNKSSQILQTQDNMEH